MRMNKSASTVTPENNRRNRSEFLQSQKLIVPAYNFFAAALFTVGFVNTEFSSTALMFHLHLFALRSVKLTISASFNPIFLANGASKMKNCHSKFHLSRRCVCSPSGSNRRETPTPIIAPSN